jgi:hypothetical protein
MCVSFPGIRTQHFHFIGQTERQQAAMWAADCQWRFERQWHRLTRGYLECSRNGFSGSGSQFLCERHLHAPPRGDVEDVPVRNGGFIWLSFFQAQGLRAELNGIVKPFTLSPMLVFYRDEQTVSLFNHVSETGEVQGFAAQVQARRLCLSTCRCALTRLVRSLVNQRPFENKFVDEHIGLHKLVVKSARAVRQRV